jgi:hypothetical protein
VHNSLSNWGWGKKLHRRKFGLEEWINHFNDKSDDHIYYPSKITEDEYQHKDKAAISIGKERLLKKR